MSHQEAAMRTLHFRSVERRRTVRVTLCAELIVQGSTENNGTFKVKARTLSVSRHGGMMVMDPEVATGQKLVLINMNCRQKAECQVVATKTARDGKRHISFKPPHRRRYDLSASSFGRSLPRRRDCRHSQSSGTPHRQRGTFHGTSRGQSAPLSQHPALRTAGGTTRGASSADSQGSGDLGRLHFHDSSLAE